MTEPRSIECQPGGSGQCDGYDTLLAECKCPCHESGYEAPLHWPSDAKVDDLKRWHDEVHGLSPRVYAIGLPAVVVIDRQTGEVTIRVGIEEADDLSESNLDYTYPDDCLIDDESMVAEALRAGTVKVVGEQ